MIPNPAETTLQQNTLDLLARMGCTYISPEAIPRYRENTRQVLLKKVLRAQLSKLNGYEYRGKRYAFGGKSIQKAIDDLEVALEEGLMAANRKISDQLVLGNAYVEEPEAGVQKSFSLHYIDFERPENNLFHITEEFVVDRQSTLEHTKTRRPDMVLFVNGISFGVIELKR